MANQGIQVSLWVDGLTQSTRSNLPKITNSLQNKLEHISIEIQVLFGVTTISPV
jgi:hypothetical protein